MLDKMLTIAGQIAKKAYVVLANVFKLGRIKQLGVFHRANSVLANAALSWLRAYHLQTYWVYWTIQV